MRNASDKVVETNQSTYFVFNDVSSENPSLYQIMWDQLHEPARTQTTVRV